MKSKNIVCFIDSFSSGGAQKQMMMLANGLSELHHVKTLQYHNLNFFSKFINKNILQHKILESNLILRIFKIIRFFNTERPDVIIAFLSGPNNYAALYKAIFFWRKTKLIVGERNLNIKPLKPKDLLVRFSHLFANYIVCNSNSQKNKLQKYFRNKLHFIPNGTDPLKYKIKSYSKSNNKIIRIVVPARFAQQKNPLNLLKAIHKIRHLIDIEIHWYGDCYEKDPLVQESLRFIEKNSLDEIFILKKPINNIHKVLSNYDALILPSLYEGCPNAIIDAMFCGLPVLASNVSDNMIYLESQKELVFDPHSIDDISSKILIFNSLDENRLKEISEKNITNAKKYFDLNKMVAKYSDLF